jgi:4-hydroxy-tetrahydrodipicolinate reductase
VTPLRIVVCGSTGRMGQALQTAIDATPELVFAGGIAAADATSPDGCGPLLQQADALIDFSSPQALLQVLEHGGPALHGKAVVIGTTGLTADVHAAIDQLATRAAVVTAANFSIGVNLLLDLVQKAASVLGEQYDIEIVEAHHRNKVDAPSGTALALAAAAATGRGVQLADVRRDGRSGNTGRRPAGEIGLHALRGGAVVGEHSVQFIADAERIELGHIAADRALFATGALRAAAWAATQPPGLYSMKDVLGL